MSGIYIHIPFCKKICYYCDFHFSLSLKNKTELLNCIEKELVSRSYILGHDLVETIYFGGGTPSLLTPEELEKILKVIYSVFNISESVEITLESNPDDLDLDYLRDIKKLGINRLSIGIQSFKDEDLVLMNRRHSSEQSLLSLENSLKAGFNNITADLIYALPNQSLKDWEYNLTTLLQFDITHISAYNLTIEKGTAFNNFVSKEKVILPQESVAIDQFMLLLDKTRQYGFEHYEISNFAKDGMYSRHNLSYWKQKKYLGVGPSAHSFDYNFRYWNISNNLKYIEAVNSNSEYNTCEELSLIDKYNEYILTSLRTMWGIDTTYITDKFGCFFLSNCYSTVYKYIKTNDIIQSGNFIILTEKGKLLADKITSDLFLTN